MTGYYQYCRSNKFNLTLAIQIKFINKASNFYFIVPKYLESKWASWSKYFWSYWPQNMCLFKSITGLLSENRLVVNVLTSPKNSWNLPKRTFIVLFHDFGTNSVRKSYFSSDVRFQDRFLTRELPTTSTLVVIEKIYCYRFQSNYLKNENSLALIC